MPYNKLLTNFTCSGLYWGILALGRFCTDLAALGPYCHDLGPIFPSTVSKRLIFYNSTKKIFSISSFFLKYLNFDSCLQLWIMSQIPNSATFTYLVKYITGYLLRVMLLLVTLQKPNRGLKPPPHPHTPPPPIHHGWGTSLPVHPRVYQHFIVFLCLGLLDFLFQFAVIF